MITPTLLSRKIKVENKLAEILLPEMVNQKILDFFIIVFCNNPDADEFSMAEHYRVFYSIEDLSKFSSSDPCSVCDCGYQYDYKNMRIGFRLANKDSAIKN